jgi:hypothetical protein
MDMIYIAKSTKPPSKEKGISVSDMDKYLEKGWEIYEREINSTEERLIATPKHGFLKEKPNPVRSYTMKIGAR